MAQRPELSPVVPLAAVCLGTGLVAAMGVGQGFANGDAAVYVAQVWTGSYGERTVHLGYLLLAGALSTVSGQRLPLVLDLVTALSATAAVVGTGLLARQRQGIPWLAAFALAAILLPRSSTAEVDALWLALVIGAALVPAGWGAGLLVALATTVSPVALLALPWLAWWRGREDWLALGLGVVGAVAGLTVFSGGEWWTGDRGVLHAPSPRVKRVLEALITDGAAWWLAPFVFAGWIRREHHGVVFTLPFLLAPPDVPAWWLAAVPLSLAASAGGRAVVDWGSRRFGIVLWVVAVALAVGQGTSSLFAWREAVVDVASRRDDIEALAQRIGRFDGLVAPWSTGVRVSMLETGDPYALYWRVPGEPVRDQGARMCHRNFPQVWVSSDVTTLPINVPLQTDGMGNRYFHGHRLHLEAFPGCPPEPAEDGATP